MKCKVIFYKLKNVRKKKLGNTSILEINILEVAISKNFIIRNDEYWNM